MKKTLLPLLMLVFGLGFGQTVQSSDEGQVQQLIIDSFQDLWSDLDSAQINTYHTDDYILLEDGLVWNNDSVRNYIRKSLIPSVRAKRENKFEFIKAEQYGNTVWIAYHNWATWSLNGTINGHAQWLESAIAVKTESGWKIKMLHSTYVPNK